LIEFLGLMAWGTRIAEDREVEQLPSLAAAIQRSFPVVMKFLDEPDVDIRRIAVDAAAEHVKTRGLAHHRPALAARLRTWARDRRDERIYWVWNLVDLKENKEEFLVDEDWPVRAAAALSPALADNPAAADVIVETLIRVAPTRECDRNKDLLPKGAYGFGRLIKAAIERVDDLHRIAIPAAQIARHESLIGYESTRGRSCSRSLSLLIRRGTSRIICSATSLVHCWKTPGSGSPTSGWLDGFSSRLVSPLTVTPARASSGIANLSRRAKRPPSREMSPGCAFRR
jgi:hypothetical protein